MSTGVTPTRPRRENEFTAGRQVYEPHRVGLPPVGPYIVELWRRREFAKELSRTYLRSQNHDTVFGTLWLVLNPLLLAGVYFVLLDIVRGGRSGAGFFAHLVAGIFAYHFVSGAMRGAVQSVTSGGKLIMNSAFPRLLLPLSSVITAVKQFLPTMVIYVPLHLLTHQPVGLQLLWLIPIVAILMAQAAGFAIIVAVLQVYFRDLKNLLPYVLRVWLYASPVLYFPDRIPQSYHWLLWVNPLAAPLSAWSHVLHAGHAPEPWSMWFGLAWGVAVLLGGALFFMSREREFAVRI